MNEEIEKPPVQYTDPINGKVIVVKSVCMPKKSLLRGGVWHRGPTVLGAQQTIKEKEHE